MSYDLVLFDCSPGDDPGELNTRLERLDEQEGKSGRDAAIEARHCRIADALLAANPALSESEVEGQRELELTDPDGLQIVLYDQQASITFPYWDSLDAEKLEAQIQDAARIINTETGWCLFDPQVERVVDPARESLVITESFDHGRDQLNRVVGGKSAEPRRPWWKRPFGGG